MAPADYPEAPDYGEVDGLPWDDRPVFIVGGGPSLIGFDFERLRGKGHIVGVNESMFRAPCDAGVSTDVNFIRNNTSRFDIITDLGIRLYLVLGPHWPELVPSVPGAVYLRDDRNEGLSLYTDTVRSGGTSGYSALNVAVLKRARRIVLLGFDYGCIGGKHHFHNAYTWFRDGEQYWPAWAKRFDAAAPVCRALDVEVINASPQSAITAFPKVSIDEALGA